MRILLVYINLSGGVFMFSQFKNKSVAVLGIGVSNTPLIKLLLKAGACVTAYDENTNLDKTALENLGCKFILGENFSIKEDIIFRTPGILPTYKALVDASERDAFITSEMQFFVENVKAKVFAITGSDGKTTTSTLIAKLLENKGFKVYLGGNIGTPLLDKLDEIKKDDIVVLELSSFQLMDMEIHPDVAVITNISPNHLDKHTDYKEYIDAKMNLIKNQKKGDRLVLNADNINDFPGYKWAKDIDVLYFSMKNKPGGGVYLNGDTIMRVINGEETPVLKATDIKLPGKHNIENFMAAICATYGFVEDFKNIANNFSGATHRLEFVREMQGVRYYNDSIASSPSRTIAGLNSFDRKVILIAGGRDKGIEYDELGVHIVKNVKTIVLIGETKDKIKKVCDSVGFKDIIIADNLEDAIMQSKNIAKSGDIVLLSPASTSFDSFKNFEQRGNMFKDIVMKL